MGNHTIYVRPENQATLDRAKEIAKRDGVSLSSVIERALEKWVEKQELLKMHEICPKCGGKCGYWNKPIGCGR